jgi:hypothetical protein
MRLLGASLIAAAVLLSSPGSATGGAPSDTPSDPQCRHQWADLAQLHGENGSPGGSAVTADLRDRWESLYDEAVRLSRQATAADCATFEGYAGAWDGLERLQYGLDAHDYFCRQRLVRGDLHHYQEFTGHDPSRRVLRAFAFLRQLTPRAAADLKPVLRRADAVDTGIGAEISAYLKEYRTAARASTAATKADRWLRIIEGAELHEE